MKSKILFSLLLIAVVLVTSCKNDEDPDPNPAQLQTQKLTGEYKTASTKGWTVSSVIFDGIDDRTSDWTNFSIDISANPSGTNNFTTQNAFSPGPWPSSGTWDFGGTTDNPNINLFVRGDGLDIAINVSDNQLTMTFTYDDNVHSGGRTEVVNGEYRFTFTAN